MYQIVLYILVMVNYVCYAQINEKFIKENLDNIIKIMELKSNTYKLINTSDGSPVYSELSYGVKCIRYDKLKFFDFLKKYQLVKIKQKLILLGILGHELGHHVLLHFTANSKLNEPMKHGYADKYAGGVLRKFNFLLEDVNIFINESYNRKFIFISQDYPLPKNRVRYAEDGWKEMDQKIKETSDTFSNTYIPKYLRLDMTKISNKERISEKMHNFAKDSVE